MKKTMKLLGTSILALTILTSCGGDDKSADSFDFNNEIQVVSREDGSGTRGAFVELFGIEVKDEQGNTQDMTYEEAIVANKTDVVLTTVSGDDYGIGYVSLGSLNDNVKAIKIDGVEATQENVLSGEYVIARPFNIATKGVRSELTEDFIKFIFSEEGQKIVSESFVPVVQGESYTSSGLEGKITIGGSTSVTPLMEKIKIAYEELNEGVDIEIQALGSSAGMTGTIEGTFDIGMASRDLKDSEKEELDYEVIANDAIAVVVNNNNEIDNLSKEEVRQIFTGEVTEWADLN